MPIFGQVFPPVSIALGNQSLTNPYPITQDTTVAAACTLPGDGKGILISCPFSPVATPSDVTFDINLAGKGTYAGYIYANSATNNAISNPGVPVPLIEGDVITLRITAGPPGIGQRFGVILIPKA